MPTPEELAESTPDKTAAPVAANLIQFPAQWQPEPADETRIDLAALCSQVRRWRAEPETKPPLAPPSRADRNWR